MGNIVLLVLGLFNLVVGGAHLVNSLSGDPSRPGAYIAAMLIVGSVCVLLSTVRV